MLYRRGQTQHFEACVGVIIMMACEGLPLTCYIMLPGPTLAIAGSKTSYGPVSKLTLTGSGLVTQVTF